MASPSQTNESLVVRKLRFKNTTSASMPNKDQRFLLYFIIGTYFGPDLKGEKLHKSVLQRKAESLPPYTSDQLAGSYIETVEVERIYYYVLRKAKKSLVAKPPLLDQFFKGNLPAPPCNDNEPAARYPQFTDLFPLELHPHSQLQNKYNVIGNIVFIDNPEISYIKIEEIARFTRLSGLEDFALDKDAARLYGSVDRNELHNVTAHKAEPNRDLSQLGSSPGSKRSRPAQDDVSGCKDQCFQIPPPLKSSSSTDAATTSNAPALTKDEKNSAAMIFFPSPPSKEELASMVAGTKTGTALTGSAAMGMVGPIVGQMDIGECDDSYIFRVSLPGVKRDESEFSCEVENDGKVLIRGVTTTGEKTVYKFSQMFEMQSQNLCPPGHFSISFQLPGPVDPEQFTGNFGTDGILEGMVMKKRHD